MINTIELFLLPIMKWWGALTMFSYIQYQIILLFIHFLNVGMNWFLLFGWWREAQPIKKNQWMEVWAACSRGERSELFLLCFLRRKKKTFNCAAIVGRPATINSSFLHQSNQLNQKSLVCWGLDEKKRLNLIDCPAHSSIPLLILIWFHSHSIKINQ